MRIYITQDLFVYNIYILSWMRGKMDYGDKLELGNKIDFFWSSVWMVCTALLA